MGGTMPMGPLSADNSATTVWSRSLLGHGSEESRRASPWTMSDVLETRRVCRIASSTRQTIAGVKRELESSVLFAQQPSLVVILASVFPSPASVMRLQTALTAVMRGRTSAPGLAAQ